MKKSLFILGLAATAFTACNITPTQEETPGMRLMRNARVIPGAVGQAVSLGTQVRGLQTMSMDTAQQSEFIHLVAQDPLGNPGLHVVFTTAEKITDWYAYGKGITTGTVGTTTLVGATTAHNVIAGAQGNINTLSQIVKAIDHIGGPSQFKSLIATTNSFEGLYVAGQSGQWVTVNSETQVLDSQVQQVITDGFIKSADALAESKVAEQLEGNWMDILEPKQAAQREMLQSIASGQALNMSTAREIMVQQSRMEPQTKGVNDGMRTQSETRNTAYCWWFLWWQICVDQYDMEPQDANYMRTAASNSNTPTSRGFGGGFNQYYTDYDQLNPYSISGAQNSGCGPSAVASLVNWHWQNGVRFDGQTASPNMLHEISTNSSGTRTVYTKYKGPSPVTRLMTRESDGMPKLSKMARSFVISGGTATTPWDLENAINAYLGEQRSGYGVNLSLDSAYTLSPVGYGALQSAAELYRATNMPVTIAALVLQLPTAIAQTPFSYAYNLLRQPIFGDIMRRHIGSKNEMVVALYPTGRSDWEAHYSAILKGRIIYHAVRPEILIEPLDKFNGRDWYALSDPLSPFVGVFALNR
jgi:hypothetical protein